MSAQPRNVNMDFLFKSGRRSSRIEFWRDNGDGTCTRRSDGLTLTYERYDLLPRQTEFVSWHAVDAYELMN